MRWFKVGLVLLLLVLTSSVVIAGTKLFIGLTPIYANQVDQTRFLPDTFSSKGLRFEVEGGLYTDIIMFRGYHLVKKGNSYSSSILDPEDKERKKFIPVTFDSTFCASRVELGLPFIIWTAALEPFFVNSYTRNPQSVRGEKILLEDSGINNTQGFGLAYTQLLSKNQSINIKYGATLTDDFLDLTYNWLTSNAFVSLGYISRKYDYIKINGPFISIHLLL